MAFLWGLQDSSTNTFLLSLIGFEFKNCVGAYSVNFLVQNLGVIAFEIVEAFLVTEFHFKFYIAFLGVLGTFSGLCTSYYYS